MYKKLKNLLDFLTALIAVIILLPVFVVVIIAIKVGSKGPAIFRQTRAGKDGKPFTFYKFRTMKTDVDPFGPSPKSGQDPRLTKIGIFLRKSSLDELPQLFNVLKGDMSLVGPRPLYMAQMAEWDDVQKKRLLVKPGITGLAQIRGRGELTIEQKLAYDVEYVQNVSFLLDLKIVLITILQVFTGKSIYEKKYSEKQDTRGESR